MNKASGLSRSNAFRNRKKTSSRRSDAERLREVGFINEIASDPLGRALEIAERAAALAPRAVETTRLVLNAAIDEGREAAIDALGAVSSHPRRTKPRGSRASVRNASPTSVAGKLSTSMLKRRSRNVV
jgi:enoyl-CoA hydratase/carnithine racemase